MLLRPFPSRRPLPSSWGAAPPSSFCICPTDEPPLVPSSLPLISPLAPSIHPIITSPLPLIPCPPVRVCCLCKMPAPPPSHLVLVGWTVLYQMFPYSLPFSPSPCSYLPTRSTNRCTILFPRFSVSPPNVTLSRRINVSALLPPPLPLLSPLVIPPYSILNNERVFAAGEDREYL